MYSQKHNFKINQLARGLRLQQSNTIGLIIPDISNEFFAHIARSIEVEARLRNYSIILCDSQDQTEKEVSLIQILIERMVDGIIVAPVGLNAGHLLELRAKKIPLVLIDRYFTKIDIPQITSANFQGALMATQYLLEMGHREITCIQGLPEAALNLDRVKGYRQAMTDNNLTENVRVIGVGFSSEDGYKAIMSLSEQLNFPTAIFSLSNIITLGAVKALREIKKSIPDQVSILTFDDHAYAAFMDPPLSVVEQNKSEMGVNAVKILDQMMEDQEVSVEPMILPCRLIRRSSVRKIN